MKQTRLIYSNLGLFLNSYSHIIRSLWIGVFGFITLVVCSRELYLAVYQPLTLNMYIAYGLVGALFYLNSLSSTYRSALTCLMITGALGFLISLYLYHLTTIEAQLYIKSSIMLMIYSSMTSSICLYQRINNL